MKLPCRLFLSALVAQVASKGVTAAPLEGSVDPKRVEQISAMLAEQPFAFGPNISERDVWKRLAGIEPFNKILQEAETTLTTPMPEMTEELYLLYKKTGRRTREYNRVRSGRHGRIPLFTIAECIENKGRFIPPLETTLRSICEEKTWIYNFHDSNLANYRGKTITIDLGSADLAQNLGACLRILGDKLSPEVRQLVAAKLRERIFEPYRKAVDGTGTRLSWITAEHNWNAVCHAGVVAAALAVCPNRDERAFFIAAAEKFTHAFLRGFGGDGYCAEGMGYWNYGFGHYIQLCETVYQATKGGVDMYQLEGASEAAMYPIRIHIINGIYPAYADCSFDPKPDPVLMHFINRRYRLGLKAFDQPPSLARVRSLPALLMYACPNSATAQPQINGMEWYEIRSFFPNGGVLNCRPLPGSDCRMAVSLKGGHNAEPHNHNDLGSFVVVVGKEALIVDPGGETYTARTFSKDRYKSNLLNSYGHPVPVVAGKLQRSGATAKALVVKKHFTDAADTYALDLRTAYDAPTLQTLTRTFVFSRNGEGTLTVTDDFAFGTPQSFGSALITYARWEQLSSRELLIHGKQEAIKVTIETCGEPFTISSELINEENPTGTKPTRISINLTNLQTKGKLTFTIVPARAQP